MSREVVKEAKRIVVKVGSSLLTKEDLSLNRDFIASIGEQLVKIRERCESIVLVTSGAVAAGLPVLGWKKRPETYTDLHVAAAVGQLSLFRAYDEILAPLGLRSAQVLLTEEELTDRTNFLNARTTLSRLRNLNVLPIVNENDAIAISERRFGENDTLAAELVHLTDAQLLIILTNVKGIYTDFDAGNTLDETSVDDKSLETLVDNEKSSSFGVGGMGKKIEAAVRVGYSGAHTIIADGHHPNVLPELLAAEVVGTMLTSSAKYRNLSAKERWLLTCARPKGKLIIDDGAVEAVTKRGRSLLPIGVVESEGDYRRGDVVLICQKEKKKQIAIGITNYDSHLVSTLLREHSSKISEIVGDDNLPDEILHRDNMVFLHERMHALIR